jgi:hypothetical protein
MPTGVVMWKWKFEIREGRAAWVLNQRSDETGHAQPTTA